LGVVRSHNWHDKKMYRKMILPTAEVTHTNKQTKVLQAIHFQAMALLSNRAKSAE